MIADLKPYPGYKESGSPWLAHVPLHWEVHNLRTLIRPRKERNRADLPLLSVARERGVFVRSLTDADENHNVIPENLSNYKVARAGNLVINKMKAWQGSMGIAPCDGIVSPAYFVFDFGIANHRFGQVLLRSKPYVSHFGQASDGVRVGQWDLTIPGMRQIPVLVPPPDEQAAIVRFLDWTNGRLDRAIRAKRKELALISEMLSVVTEKALQLEGTRRLRLSTVAEVVSRPVHRRADHNYTRIGLYNRGRGIFHKAITDGTELGDSDFFWVEDGDFVISGQFAWEGAVALARAKDSGCVASHRYPILRGREEYASSAVLFALFRTSYGTMLLDHHSRGAAGRNRPLNARKLLKEKVPIPPISAQARIIELIQQEYAVTQSLVQTIRFINEYRTRLVADVVTGKLDVREAAALLPEEAGESLTESETDWTDDEAELDPIVSEVAS